jgi:hypothetical protein
MTFYEKVPKDASPEGLLNASLYIEGSALSIEPTTKAVSLAKCVVSNGDIKQNF